MTRHQLQKRFLYAVSQWFGGQKSPGLPICSMHYYDDCLHSEIVESVKRQSSVCVWPVCLRSVHLSVSWWLKNPRMEQNGALSGHCGHCRAGIAAGKMRRENTASGRRTFSVDRSLRWCTRKHKNIISLYVESCRFPGMRSPRPPPLTPPALLFGHVWASTIH